MMLDDYVLVTGGNSGLGFECARELARKGRKVIIASRNREASDRAVGTIRRESGENSALAMDLDLGSIESVRNLVADIDARDLPLQALVCNAGIQFSKVRRRTPEGREMTFAVNHLGHFLLVQMLLDRLRRIAPARIVVVASGVHDPALNTGMPRPTYQSLEDLADTGGSPEDAYNGQLAYVNSKLCNLWFTYELVRRLGGSEGERHITVNAFCPGLIPGSGLARDYPPALRFIWDAILPAFAKVVTLFTTKINTAPKSGKALARLVLDPGMEGVTGNYYSSYAGWKAAPSSEASYDEAMAGRLWDLSLEWTAQGPA